MTEQLLTTAIKPKLSSRLKSKEAYIEACQVLAEAQIATVEGNKNLLVDKVKLHLRRSEKHHFNGLALGLSRFLQSYYTFVKRNKNKAAQYKVIRQKYIQLSNIEELVDLKFLDITEKINSKKYPNVFKKELHVTCNELRGYLKLKSAPISTKIYSLNIILAYLNNDYNRVIALCREIISWLDSKGFGWYAPFYYYLVPACIIQKRFVEGKTYIKRAMGSVNRKSNNWNTFAYARFLLEMHAENYQEAYIMYKKIERKKIENPALKERWMIAKAYLNFLIQQGKINAKGNFKLTKFLNEVPVSNMDKAGNNVDVIILSIIHRYQNDRTWIIDKQEAIEKYMQRYLNGRSKLILKMLLSGIQNNFDKESMEVNNWRHMEKLMKNEEGNNEILAFEIIPFERLWGMVLTSLQK